MSQNKQNKNEKKAPLFKAGIALALGLEMGVSIALGYFIGSFLDKKFNSSPWLTILFFILGVATAFRQLLQRIKVVK